MLSLTLTSMEVNHAGINVSPCGAHGPYQRRQVLMHVWDGQGLSVDCPPPHGHHECDRVDQVALVKRQELVYGVMDLDVCNLYIREWRCKFLQMVLQYRRLCLSHRIATSVYSVFKFSLYIVYHV